MSEEETSKDSREETGNKNFLIAGGIGAYGTTLALTTSYICPICVIAAPAFLGWGAVQKYKHLKAKSDQAEKD